MDLTALAAKRTPEQVKSDNDNRYACDEQARIATGADRAAWRVMYCSCVKARVTDQRDWCK